MEGSQSGQMQPKTEKSPLELTDGEKKILSDKYKILLNEYKHKIAQLADHPDKILENLTGQRVIEDKLIALQKLISSLQTRKQQNEALFEIFSEETKYEDLNRIKKAMEDSGNERLGNIFDIIGVRLKASVNKPIKVKPVVEMDTVHYDNIGNPGEPLGEARDRGQNMPLNPPSPPPRRLHQAAFEGDYNAVKDILTDTEYELEESWFPKASPTEISGRSPIHYAALGQNSKNAVEFTKALLEEAISKGIPFLPGELDRNGVATGRPASKVELINRADDLKNTALHLAAENESVRLVEYLCEQGARFLNRNDDKLTQLQIMYEKTPEAVVHLLNGALTADNDDSRDRNLKVKMDFRAIIGSAADDPDDDDGHPLKNKPPYNEMELLANMVFQNHKESSKIILPHVVVKAFLDLKWRKLRASIFFYSVFYVLIHLWFTYFVIQLFVVSYPFRQANITNETSTDGNGEAKLTFFSYIRGNWKSVTPHVVIDETNPLPTTLYEQGIAFMAIGVCLFIIETMECNAIFEVANDARKTNLQYRHIVLSFILIAVAVYNENMEAIIVGLFILIFHIHDEINTQKGRVRYRNIKCQGSRPLLPLVLIAGLYLWAIFRSLLHYNSIATGAVAIFNFAVFFFTFFEGNHTVDVSKKQAGSTNKLSSFVVSFVWSVKYFFNRLSAYLASAENILQLVFIGLMIDVSTVVSQTEISSGYYCSAAFSVVLAWILILLQIGNVYGIGVYIHIFKTVLKRFLGVMSAYLVVLIAFSIAFSIIFPQENLFATLPASFFRVVSMMVGELNFDDIFNKDGNEETLRAFPYASQWIHTGFIVTVTVVLVNLLIGLTVSDIEKIFEVSDVIHRSIQVERLYIMERLYSGVPILGWLNGGKRFVIPQQDVNRVKGQGLELIVGIKELPKALHKEIRLLAESPDAYSKAYLQK